MIFASTAIFLLLDSVNISLSITVSAIYHNILVTLSSNFS